MKYGQILCVTTLNITFHSSRLELESKVGLLCIQTSSKKKFTDSLYFCLNIRLISLLRT